MATSRTDKASRRSADAVTAIRAALEQGDTRRALQIACDTVKSESVKVYDHRWADAQLIAAELAGSLAALAAQLHDYKPRKPRGLVNPSPNLLLTTFEQARNPQAPGDGESNAR
jgi:hypothetical protein